jgi:hypothetical protein
LKKYLASSFIQVESTSALLDDIPWCCLEYDSDIIEGFSCKVNFIQDKQIK